MMKSKRENRFELWGWIPFGACCTFFGAHKVLTGEPGIYWDVEIPAWTGWVELPTGLWVLFLSIRALRRARKEPEPSVVIDLDEEAARAEEAMDVMYLREHGELPEKPWKDEK